MLTLCYTPRSEHMVKHFFAKLFLCEQKKRAVQHAMLVHFLLLLCAHKEVDKQTNKITVVPKRYYGYTLLFNYTYAAFKSFSFFF